MKYLPYIIAAVVLIAIGGVLVTAYGDAKYQAGILSERNKNAQAMIMAQNKARSEIIKAKGEYDEIFKEIQNSNSGCVGDVIQRTINRLPVPNHSE